MSAVLADGRGWTGAPARAGSLAARLFAIDLRTLAAFRIALALLLLTDLWWRSHWLQAHYSDQGVLPRRALLEHFGSPWSWSLHMLSGLWQIEAVLFAIAGACALGLLLGWRTRLMTILSWVLLTSLHTRNPLVLQGGDVLLRCLAFWAMFLPLGARWSLDRACTGRVADVPRAIASVATAALLLQVCMVYWCTGIMKSSPIWTTDHTAIQYALSLGAFCTPLGSVLLQFPMLMKVLTAACLLLERYGPLLVLLPLARGWVRMGVVALFMGLHIGMACTMRLGPFPYICLTAWLTFVPSVVWDALGARLGLGRGLTLELAGAAARARLEALLAFLVLPRATISQAPSVDPAGAASTTAASWSVRDAAGALLSGPAAFAALLRASPWAWWLAPLGGSAGVFDGVAAAAATCRAHLGGLVHLLTPSARPAAAESETARIGMLPPLATAACTGFLMLTLLWNVRSVFPSIGRVLMPHVLDPLVQIVRLDQRWNMFAPYPSRQDIWYSAPAHQRGGGAVDLLSGEAPMAHASYGIDMPIYEDERWRKYLSNLHKKENVPVRTYLAQYLYRSWNQAHAAEPEQQVTKVEIRLWSRETSLDSVHAFGKRDIWVYEPGKHVHTKTAAPEHQAATHTAAATVLASTAMPAAAPVTAAAPAASTPVQAPVPPSALPPTITSSPEPAGGPSPPPAVAGSTSGSTNGGHQGAL